MQTQEDLIAEREAYRNAAIDARAELARARDELAQACRERDRLRTQATPPAPPLPSVRAAPHEPPDQSGARLSRDAGERARSAAATRAAGVERTRNDEESARRMLADARLELARVANERDEQRARAERAQAELHRCEQELLEAVAERDSAQALAESYRRQLARLEHRRREAEETLAAAQEDIEALRRALSSPGAAQAALDSEDDADADAESTCRSIDDSSSWDATAPPTDPGELQRRLDDCIVNASAMILEWKTRALEAERRLEESRGAGESPAVGVEEHTCSVRSARSA